MRETPENFSQTEDLNQKTPVVSDVRGELTIVGTCDGRIAWPIGRRKGSRAGASLVVYRGLAKADRKESNIAVQHWWGVSPSTVWKWRRALDVPAKTDGTLHLRAEHCAGMHRTG